MNGAGAEEVPRDAMRHIEVRKLLKLPHPLVLCTQLYAPCNRCKMLMQITNDKTLLDSVYKCLRFKTKVILLK